MIYYYYLRDKAKRPVVTICLLQENGVACRGVAICSPLDSPNKKLGRAIALGRARRALQKQKSGMPILRTVARQVTQSAIAAMHNNDYFRASIYDSEHSWYARLWFKSVYQATPLEGIEKRLSNRLTAA